MPLTGKKLPENARMAPLNLKNVPAPMEVGSLAKSKGMEDGVI